MNRLEGIAFTMIRQMLEGCTSASGAQVRLQVERHGISGDL